MKKIRRYVNILGIGGALLFVWMFCYTFFIALLAPEQEINLSVNKYGEGWFQGLALLIVACFATHFILGQFIDMHRTRKKAKLGKGNVLIKCPKCPAVFEVPETEKVVECPFCNTKGTR